MRLSALFLLLCSCSGSDPFSADTAGLPDGGDAAEGGGAAGSAGAGASDGGGAAGSAGSLAAGAGGSAGATGGAGGAADGGTDAPAVCGQEACGGWVCGSVIDGCGVEQLCGPVYESLGDFYGKGCPFHHREGWQCFQDGGVTQMWGPGGPAPRSDCMRNETQPDGPFWCCTE